MLFASITPWASVATLAAATLGAVAWTDAPGPVQGRPAATAGPSPSRVPDSPAPPGRGDAAAATPVDRALIDAVQAAEANPDVPERIADLIRIAQAYTRRGDRVTARAMLDRARALIDEKEPTARGAHFLDLVDLAAEFARNGDRGPAHEVFEHAAAVLEAAPVAGPELSWSLLLDAQVGFEGRQAARPNVDRIRRFLLAHEAEAGIESPEDVRLMQLRAIAGDFAGALTQINDSPRFRGEDRRGARVEALVEVARLVRQEDGPAGDAPLDAARDAALHLANPQLAARGLAAIVKVLARLDRFEASRAPAERLDALMREPIVFSTELFGYTDAMGMLCLRLYARGDFEGARRTALGAAAVLKLRPIRPDQPMQTANLALVLALLGEDAAILEVADRLADDEQRWDWLGWLPSCFRLAGREADAARLDPRTMALVEKNVAAGAAADGGKAGPDGSRDVDAWSHLLAVQHASRGDFDRASKAIEAVPAGRRRDTLISVVRYLSSTGHLAEALALARRPGDEATRRRLLIEAATAFPGPTPFADLLARRASY